MKSNSTGEASGLLTKKTFTVVAAVVVVVAAGWFAVARYQQGSGATLRQQILSERPGAEAAKSSKDTKPLETFYDNLEGLDLTAEQWEKIDAVRGLPTDDDGWIARKKAVDETLTEEQTKQLMQAYGAGMKQEWAGPRNLRPADQRAVKRRLERGERGKR